MNKKSFIITSIIMGVLLIATIITFIIINPFKDKDENKKSAELLKYEAMFNLELVNNEYTIHELRDEKLSVVVIPDTIDNIPVTRLIDSTEDFASYRSVSTLVISKNIKCISTISSETDYLGYKILANATGLSRIEVHKDNPYYASVGGVLYSKDLKILLKYPNSKEFTQAYLTVTIPDEVETIYDHAFYLNNNLSVLICNPNLKKIGNYVFSNNSSLSSVKLNEGLSIIGTKAFEKCTNLSEIELPSSLESVKNSAFMNCSKLSNITILNENTVLGEHLFTQTSKNVTLYLPISMVNEININPDPKKRLESIPALSAIGFSFDQQKKMVIRAND